jgi:hypothetical protein
LLSPFIFSTSAVLPRPSMIASAKWRAINSMERMLSSLPGIGRSTVSGSLSVSIKEALG